MANTLYDFYTGQGQKLPSISERAKTYESSGLGSASAYTGTAEQNTALLKSLQTPEVPDVIDASSLSGDKTVNIPEQPSPEDVASTSAQNIQNVSKQIVDTAKSSIDKQIKDAEDKRLKAIQEQTGLTSEYEKLLEQTVNKQSDLYKAQEKAGVSTMNKQLQNVINQMNAVSASLKLGVTDQEGKVIPMKFITGRTAQMKNQALAQQSALAVQAQALQGNISLAKSTAESLINAQYAPIEQAIANQKEIIALNYDNLSLTDKVRADELTRLYSQKEQEIADEKEEQSKINDIMIKAAENNASQDVLDAISKSSTEREAIYNAGNSLANFATNELLSPNEASTLGVPYGTTQKQAAKMGLVPNAVLTPEDKIKQEYSMSKTIDSSTEEANNAKRQIGIMEAGYNEALAAGLDGTSNNAPSQAVLVTFQKLLDPTSVVRESEYARSGDGQSISQRMQGTYEKLLRGGAGVTQAELKNFYDLSQQLLKGYNEEQLNTLKRTRTQADNWGLKLENIITPEAQKLLEEDDAQRLTEYYNNNPEKQSIIDDIIQNEPNISDYDIMRIMGQGFNSVGGDTNEASKIAEAIGEFESKGNYNAIGPEVTSGMYKGDHAYGKYQIMSKNIPSWSKEALGYSITKEQFLNSPELQDKIAQYKINQSLQKYGTVEDVASVWFSGQPVSLAGNRSDVLGTTVPQYIQNIVNNYNKLS